MEVKRECGDCTMCCEGHLHGTVYGKQFHRGNPCHYLVKGKGCSIYKDRPESPCKTYKCAWLATNELPTWMKPNEVDAIIDFRKTKNNITYLNVEEGNASLRAEVLNWVVLYCNEKNLNFSYPYKGVRHYIGTQEFKDSFKV